VDAVRGNCRLKQSLIKDKRYENMFLLPAAQTKDKTAVTEGQMIELCTRLKEEFEYVLIDCPAGIEHGFKNAIAGAEEAIVVTTPEVSAVRDADRIVGLLEAAGLRQPKLIINRIRAGMIKSGDMMSVDDILEILTIDLIGIVPDDDAIVVSTNRGEPTVMDNDSHPGQAFRNISHRIVGEDVPLMSMEHKQGFLSRIKTLFAGD
jgi:septum site-determining protein MinD